MSTRKNEAPRFHVEAARAELLRAVSAASKAVERRNSMPILAFVQLAMGFGTLAVTGTNLDAEVRVEIEARGEGATCLPAHRLRDMLKALPSEVVSLTSDADGVVTLKAGETEVTYGSLPSVDHPEIGVDAIAWSVTLADGVFAYLLGGAATAMSSEETRYYLNGVCLEFKDGYVIATGTDGHRLVSRSSRMPADIGDRTGIIVPRDAVRLALAQIGGGEAKITAYTAAKDEPPSKIEIVGGDARLRAKLIAGTFPDWRRVVPRAEVQPLALCISDLRRALQMAKANTEQRGRAVKLEPCSGGVRLSMNNPDAGKLTTRLPCVEVPAFSGIGMNAQYLADLVDAHARIGSETLRLHITGPGEPVRILPDPAIVGSLSVLMPMRV